MVVEGAGDHALEYMTGGTAVILGPTGRNLGAGMSGGYGYVLDLDRSLVNGELVDLESVAVGDAERLREIVEAHVAYTGSAVGAALLADWAAALGRFTAVVPRDFKRVLEATKRATAAAPTWTRQSWRQLDLARSLRHVEWSILR